MKPDQERVSTLLLDTVTLLCRNGLTFQSKLTVQGLIGVTVDSEVFIVHINENIVEENSYNYDEPSKTPAQSVQISAGELVPSQQFAGSCSTVATTKSQTRNRKIHNPNAPEGLYGHSAMGALGANDIIDIKSEGEEDEMNSNFKQNIVHQSLTLESENVQYQQMLSANKLAYCKQTLNDTEAGTDNGPFESVQPKMELNYNYSMTGGYGSEEQDLDGFIDGDQQDYQAMGEEYADEEALEEDEKPDLDFPSTSFSSWEQQHTQFATNCRPLPGRRSATYGPKKTANRRMMKTNASSTSATQHGFAHVGQRFPQHQRQRAVTASFPLKAAAEPSAANADVTIKTMTTFLCNIDGCRCSFTLKCNLRRHQRQKHGRAKKQRPSMTYDQYGVTEDE